MVSFAWKNADNIYIAHPRGESHAFKTSAITDVSTDQLIKLKE
ncbi:hypothetical protein [Chitinophaga silvatica]|nr:hypothetical protein [Chitinophaga silvatica]